VPRQLPLAARGFVGRTKHLAELDALLQADSVVISALDGTAGIGKTTLAVHWAHRVQHHFPDGTLHTNLRGYGPGDPATPAEVLDEFLLALGIPAERIPTGTEAKAALFRSVLAGKRVLMVLDNANAVSQVRPLLPGSPGCLVLITSRASLTGLVVNDGAHRVTLDLLTMEEATNLVRNILGARADADPEAVTDLIRQCANLPLALRIAAGRAATQPYLDVAGLVADIADDQHRWEALTVPGDEATAVRAVFDWSYHRLSAEQARVFRRLGLHPGAGVSLHAAAAVTDLDLPQARRVLDALADVHLIEPVSPHRYRLHDLLRAYASDRAELEDTPEDREQARKSQTAWYAHHADAAVRLVNPALANWNPTFAGNAVVAPKLTFATLADAVAWIDIERPNLVACAHQANLVERPELTYSVAFANAQLFERMGYRDDMLHMCHLALTSARAMGDRSAEARANILSCEMHVNASRWEEATEYGMAALDLGRELGHRYLESGALNGLGLVHLDQGLLPEAEKYFKDALQHSVGMQLGRMEAVIEANLSALYSDLGAFESALHHGERSLSFRRQARDHVGELYTLLCIARAHEGMGSDEDAIRACEQALESRTGYAYSGTTARVLSTLGSLLQKRGQGVRAEACWRDALQIYEAYADPRADELRQRLNDMQAPPSTPAR
jgi:tetratricopeptide (TPR) repeat protein